MPDTPRAKTSDRALAVPPDEGAPTDAGARSPAPSWGELIAPVRALVWLLIGVSVIEIFLRAELLVVHLFNVALLFIFASVIAVSLTPVVDRMQRMAPFRRRRIIPVLALFAGVLAAAAGLVALLVPAAVDEARQLPSLVSTAQEWLNRLPVHVNLPRSGASLEGGLGPVLGVVSGTVAGAVDIVLIIVISIYLLAEGRELIATLRRLFDRHVALYDFVLLAVGGTIANYVRGQLLMSLLIGSYTGAGMALIHVRYAVGLGLAAAVLEFLPIVGAPIAMALAVAVALFQSPLLAAEAAGIGLLGHVLEAYVIGPRINARVVRLHPLVAMGALLFGAELGGILGALFAVPLAAVINIFLGALYRWRRGEHPFTTSNDSVVHLDHLPRLGDEIKQVEEEAEIVNEPVPHAGRPPAMPR